MNSAKADLEKAHEIVHNHGSFVGAMGSMRENIAQAVAAGIAAGRKDGLRMAAEIVEEEFRTTAGAIIDRLRKEISNRGTTFERVSLRLGDQLAEPLIVGSPR
jgi:hypothetical protein